MNFAEPVVSKMTEVYQTVHMRELTDVPENDPDDHPTCDALALAKVEQEVLGKNPTFRIITISPFGSA